MQIKLGIEHNWIEEGVNGKIVRRAMSLDEYLDCQCEVCLEKEQVFEINIKNYQNEVEYILVCEECAKIIVQEKMNEESFTDIMKIIRL